MEEARLDGHAHRPREVPVPSRGAVEGGKPVSFGTEPGVVAMKRSWVETLSLLPMEGFL